MCFAALAVSEKREWQRARQEHEDGRGLRCVHCRGRPLTDNEPVRYCVTRPRKQQDDTVTQSLR